MAPDRQSNIQVELAILRRRVTRLELVLKAILAADSKDHADGRLTYGFFGGLAREGLAWSKEEENLAMEDAREEGEAPFTQGV